MANVYPPLVETFMPAFTGSQAKLTFTLSPYSSLDGVHFIHVYITDQQTNIPVLKNRAAKAWINSSPTDLAQYDTIAIKQNILIIPINDSIGTKYSLLNRNTDGSYTIKIPNYLLKTKVFSVDTYYKCQIRFDETSGLENVDLVTYDNYSEWSTICLIRYIGKCTYNWTSLDVKSSDGNYFNVGTVQLVGTVNFDSKETLQSYEITIFETDDPENILYETGTIYTGDQTDKNQINTLLFLDNADINKSYSLQLKIKSKNQFQQTKVWKDVIKFFDYLDEDLDLNPVWTFNQVKEYPNYLDSQSTWRIATEEDGSVIFNIKHQGSGIPAGYMYVKRASNLDNFKTWELLSCTSENGSNINRTFVDNTVGSLVAYRYSVQYCNEKGTFGRRFTTKDIVIYPTFSDILLSRWDSKKKRNRQLAIRYNGNITGLKPNVNRVKVDTLGGKYPRFAENAQMNYKSFSISGYISAESDFNRQFLDDRDYYNQMLIYDENMDGKYEIRNDTLVTVSNQIRPGTNSAHDIDINKIIDDDQEFAYYKNSYKAESYTNSPQNASHTNTYHDVYPKDNWWWERKFRDEAIEWLNDGEPKLFRTMTEGNMTVMLTDIALTPNNTVGRRLYEFSCTAYEIEDGYSLDILDSLGIIHIRNDQLKSTEDVEAEENEYETISKSLFGQIWTEDRTGLTKVSSGDINDTTAKPTMVSLFSEDNSIDYNKDLNLNVYDKLFNVIYNENSSLGIRYQPNAGSFIIKNLKIQFESEPQRYKPDLTLYTNEISEAEAKDDTKTEEQKKALQKTLLLGYKIGLKLAGSTNFTNIFVNQKGFYQIPSNLDVIDVCIYDGAAASIVYELDYNLIYNSVIVPDRVRVNNVLVGQLTEEWNPLMSVRNLLKLKYERNYTDSQIILGSWTMANIEVNPYTEFAIKFDGDSDYSSSLNVGYSGILNLVNDYKINDILFAGLRMVRTFWDKKEHLDPWEYVLDDSALADGENYQEQHGLTWNEWVLRRLAKTEKPILLYKGNSSDESPEIKIGDGNQIISTSDLYIKRYWNGVYASTTPWESGFSSLEGVPNPQYNTIYGVQGQSGKEYYIYYLNDKFYPVSFYDNNHDICLAKVPIYGMVTYKITLISQEYD